MCDVQRFDDWLVCMVSSQLHQSEPELDDFIRLADADFASSGLKVSSVVRLSRVAVLQGDLMLGRLGEISQTRLVTLKKLLACWVELGGQGAVVP